MDMQYLDKKQYTSVAETTVTIGITYRNDGRNKYHLQHQQ